MARPTSKHPTELELAILQAIWRRGTPLTGREVQAALGESGRELAFTSVVTVLNIMARKGYLTRKKPKGGGSFAYTPRVSERVTAGGMLRDLIDRVFHGSAGAVLLKLLEDETLDAAAIARLREVVDRHAAESKPEELP